MLQYPNDIFENHRYPCHRIITTLWAYSINVLHSLHQEDPIHRTYTAEAKEIPVSLLLITKNMIYNIVNNKISILRPQLC